MTISNNLNKIYIFDNVYPSHVTQKIYSFILNSYFKLNLNDSESFDYKSFDMFGAIFTKEDLIKLGAIEHLPINIKSKFKMNLNNLNRCLINAVTSAGVYHPHDDSLDNAKWSFIYYANMKWDLEWGADTLFLNNNKEDIIKTVQCKPNRVVIFDATIPHLIRPCTSTAPAYRFSLNMTFSK